MKSGQVTVGVNCYDVSGKFIGNAGSATAAEGDPAWKSITFLVNPPPGTNRASFWIKAGGNAVVADLDDFTLDPAQ